MSERGSVPHITTSQTLRNPCTDFRSQTLQVIEALPAIIEKYPHPPEHKNKERKKRGSEREREEGGGSEMNRGIFMKDLDTCRDSFPGSGPSGRRYFLRLERKIKCQALSRCNLNNVWCHIKCSLDNNERASINCTSEVQWILAQCQLSKYAYGPQGTTNRIYRTH